MISTNISPGDLLALNLGVDIRVFSSPFLPKDTIVVSEDIARALEKSTPIKFNKEAPAQQIISTYTPCGERERNIK